jgi:hypothetical protein
MGFEIELRFVAITDNFHAGYNPLEVGRFDLCKPGYGSSICSLHFDGACGSLPCSVYDDCSQDTSEDLYGDEVWAHPIEDVIAALKKDASNGGYWRFQTAVEMLESISMNWEWFGEPHVITYGH